MMYSIYCRRTSLPEYSSIRSKLCNKKFNEDGDPFFRKITNSNTKVYQPAYPINCSSLYIFPDRRTCPSAFSWQHRPKVFGLRYPIQARNLVGAGNLATSVWLSALHPVKSCNGTEAACEPVFCFGSLVLDL